MNLRTICSWCGKVMREGDTPDARVSHGICPACIEKLELPKKGGKRV